MKLEASVLNAFDQRDLDVIFAALQAMVENCHAPQDQLSPGHWERAKELCKGVTEEVDERRSRQNARFEVAPMWERLREKTQQLMSPRELTDLLSAIYVAHMRDLPESYGIDEMRKDCKERGWVVGQTDGGSVFINVPTERQCLRHQRERVKATVKKAGGSENGSGT